MGSCRLGTPGRKEYRVDVFYMTKLGGTAHTTISTYQTNKDDAIRDVKERVQKYPNFSRFKTVTVK